MNQSKYVHEIGDKKQDDAKEEQVVGSIIKFNKTFAKLSYAMFSWHIEQRK